MANFKAHVSIAAAVSGGAAGLSVNLGMIEAVDAPWLAFLSVSAVLFAVKDDYSQTQLGLIAGAVFLLVRYGVFALFNQFTSHRGVFHSLLAAVFFAFLMTCISFYFLEWDVLHAWLNGVFLAIGFIVHLLLDEIYSVDLSNARMKKSFGTAFKLASYKNIPASVLMAICTLALYWMAPSPIQLVQVWSSVQWQDVMQTERFL